MTDAVNGHVVVRARALQRVFGALAAKTLGVAPGAVSVRIADDRGLVRVDIRAPYADRDASVVETAERVQTVVREQGLDLTGTRIGRVVVRITDIIPAPRRSLT